MELTNREIKVMAHILQQVPLLDAMDVETHLKLSNMEVTSLAKSFAIGTCAQSAFSVTTNTNLWSNLEILMRTLEDLHGVIDAETKLTLANHSSGAVYALTMYAEIAFQI